VTRIGAVCLGGSPAFSNATLLTNVTILKPQNCGAVSLRACKHIEREATRNCCKIFNAFCTYALRLTLDAERAGERKLARLQRLDWRSRASLRSAPRRASVADRSR
jgi:hypothetical protein